MKEALSQLGLTVQIESGAETVTGVLGDVTSLSPERVAKVIDLVNECKDLKTLQLVGAELTDADLRRLHGIAPTNLSLIATSVTRESLPVLNLFSSLKDLNISKNEIEYLEADDLNKLTSLQQLRMHDIRASAWLETIESFPKLRALSLGPLVTDADLKHISKLKHLEELDLLEAAWTGAGVLAIAANDNIKSLSLIRCRLDEQIAKILSTASGLTSLSIVGGELTDAPFRTIFGIQRLEHLRVSECQLKVSDRPLDRALAKMHRTAHQRQIGILRRDVCQSADRRDVTP